MHDLEALARKIDQIDQNTTETRRILVESTVDRPSVLDTLRKHDAQLGAATDRLQQLQDTAAKVRDEVVGAQAVLVHMSKEIAEKYGIKDGDTMDQEGNITRKAG